MDWLSRLQTESSFQLAQTGLSRKVLRHLILSHEIRVGSQVLVVGCGTGALVRFLNDLGVKASGFDESEVEIDQAHDDSPYLSFYGGEISQRLAEVEYPVDLIVVRRHSAYQLDLLSDEAFAMSAELLSCLRPGGYLSFVQDAGQSWPPPGHAQACFQQHLQQFPENIPAITQLHNSPIATGMLSHLLHPLQHQHNVTIASYQTPAAAVPRDEWVSLAQDAAEKATPCGCEFISDSQAA